MLDLANPTRRAFIGGLAAFIAAPAIVRASSIMPIKALQPEYLWLSHEALMEYHPGVVERLKAIMTGEGIWSIQELGWHNHLRDMFVVRNTKRVRGLLRHDSVETIDAGLARYYFPVQKLQRVDPLNDNALPPTSWE